MVPGFLQSGDGAAGTAALHRHLQYPHGPPRLQRSDLHSRIPMERIANIDVVATVVTRLSRYSRAYRLAAFIDGERAPVLRPFHAPGLGGEDIPGHQMGLLAINPEFPECPLGAVEGKAGPQDRAGQVARSHM